MNLKIREGSKDWRKCLRGCQGWWNVSHPLIKQTTNSVSVVQEGSNEGGTGSGRSGMIGEKWRKLEIPVFAGDEAYGWTNRLERYFHLKGVTEEERMKGVMVALEGKALNWFQWWETCHPHPTWETFKDAVVIRFQPTMLQNPFEVLLGLRQTGPIGKYIEQFEQYAGFMKGMQQDYLVGIFLNVLKEDIKAEVKLYEPQNLAQMVEEKVRVITKGDSLTVQLQSNTYRQLPPTCSYSKEGGNSVCFTNSNRGSGESSGCVSTINSSPVGTQQRGTPFRKLSQEELQDKIKKGLCFRCDEKFGQIILATINSFICCLFWKRKCRG
ncbi:uncharacterized protein LOC111242769 [Vigna radiata var. radiata]|uniref:Uncharacterized protein LOC111242769 n=1 Tax=Vigna radiata var. radiata TaxID=3916 RepID=A0A3Q0FKL8_VIGRR|nr:uncharacterized protein LOC111242769 [Vigna radiata var. radiata]